jgi:hypothetical protein
VSNTEYPPGGECEKCGSGTHLDEEGRTACDGCGKTTDRCDCG